MQTPGTLTIFQTEYPRDPYPDNQSDEYDGECFPRIREGEPNTDMTTELETKISKVKALCRRVITLADAATPGPWHYCAANKGECECGQINDKEGFILRLYCIDHADAPDPCTSKKGMLANAAFITEASAFTATSAQSTLDAVGALEQVLIYHGTGIAEPALRLIASRFTEEQLEPLSA